VSLISGFSSRDVEANGIRLHVSHGGAGPPVLLLHGYPQTHVMWRRVAPALAERFTVVCADLRGYGDSGKPPGDQEHVGYAKRTMAQDQLALMQALGHDHFAVVAHDRGARVALRLALDHPATVTRLAILDIVPTSVIYGSVDDVHARSVWRYFFLTQPFDLPERLIGANPDFYLRWTLDEWCGTPSALADDVVAEYLRCFDASTIHASCEDYRAGATIDLAHDGSTRARSCSARCWCCGARPAWASSTTSRPFGAVGHPTSEAAASSAATSSPRSAPRRPAPSF
jgi:haloacetate dehalogenase